MKKFVIIAVILVIVIVLVVLYKKGKCTLCKKLRGENATTDTGTATGAATGAASALANAAIDHSKQLDYNITTPLNEVKAVQELLNLVGGGLSVDGLLGSNTERELNDIGLTLPTSVAATSQGVVDAGANTEMVANVINKYS